MWNVHQKLIFVLEVWGKHFQFIVDAISIEIYVFKWDEKKPWVKI
jgi:hypothetical protein